MTSRINAGITTCRVGKAARVEEVAPVGSDDFASSIGFATFGGACGLVAASGVGPLSRSTTNGALRSSRISLK